MKSVFLEEIYLRQLQEERDHGFITWPSRKYEQAPEQFCIDILGFAPTAWQADVLHSLTTEDKIAVKGARKGGKSKLQAAGALWYYCLYDDSTIPLVAPTEGQIQRIVWHDMLMLHAGSGRCVECKLRNPAGPRPCPHSACIDGAPSPSCRSGLQVGARRIFGIAPRNADHMRGISGAHQLYFLDESPGIDPDIEAACEGNVAATGRTVAAFGNPSERVGWFFDAHQEGSSWKKFTWSALDSPNVVLGRRVVEGLADLKWITAMQKELDVDDPRYQVDVLGQFPSRDALRVISEADLAKCFRRAETEVKNAQGDLVFGIDAAKGTGGDDSVIAARRGYRFEPLHQFQGATDRIMLELSVLIAKLRRGKEIVRIKYDSAGRYGADLGRALGQLRREDDNIQAEGLDGRGFIQKIDPLYGSGFSRPRDAYWGNAARVMKTVASIPYHEELREDFRFAEWEKDRFGRDKLKEKSEHRKATGRSPDCADGVAYCLWEGSVAPLSEFTDRVAAKLAADIAAEAAEPPDERSAYDMLTGEGRGLDPYSGGGGFKR